MKRFLGRLAAAALVFCGALLKFEVAWNLGDILDAIEPVMPHDAPALIHGDRVITWPEMARRSNNVARALRARGAGLGTGKSAESNLS